MTHLCEFDRELRNPEAVHMGITKTRYVFTNLSKKEIASRFCTVMLDGRETDKQRR